MILNQKYINIENFVNVYLDKNLKMKNEIQ